jgi:hypothetical protein
VAVGLDAKIRLDAYASDTLHGEITEIASDDMAVSPASISIASGGQLATVTDAAGIQRPQSASYEARVPLKDLSQTVRAGMRGRAKISGKPQTLAARAWRLLNRTFHISI